MHLVQARVRLLRWQTSRDRLTFYRSLELERGGILTCDRCRAAPNRDESLGEKLEEFRAGRNVMQRLIEEEVVRLRTQSPERERERKKSMVYTIIVFIIGFSVILSYDWRTEPPGWRPDAPFVILFGILVAAIIYLATTYESKFRFRRCPECGRQKMIPADAILCPYCGHRF